MTRSNKNLVTFLAIKFFYDLLEIQVSDSNTFFNDLQKSNDL